MKARYLITLLGGLMSVPLLPAQTLTWTIDGHTYSVIGGISGRPGVGAAVLGNTMQILFTPTNDPYGDPFNDQYVHVVTTNGSSFTTDQRVNAITGNTVSDANPSVTVAGATIYLTVNSSQSSSNPNNGGFTGVFQSTDGLNYTLAPQPPLNGEYVLYSPSMTTDQSTGDVYLGYTNAADFTLTLCRLASGATSWTCQNFPGTREMGYNPGLVYWNGVLYIGFTQKANSHDCDLFTSTDHGQTIQENTSLGNDQSSSNPSLAVYNNVLYYGFRSNDSGDNFLYKYSLDGVNFSSHQTTNNTKLGGAPMMVNGAGLQYNSNLLWNFNSANDSSNWLWWETAQ